MKFKDVIILIAMVAMMIMLLTADAGAQDHSSLLSSATKNGEATVGYFATNDVYEKVMKEINWQRMKRFRMPLRYRYDKQTRCDSISKSLTKRFNHIAGDYTGECIQKGGSVNEIVDVFMQSEPHRKSLMSLSAKEVCISIYNKQYMKQSKNETTFSSIYYTVIRTY